MHSSLLLGAAFGPRRFPSAPTQVSAGLCRCTSVGSLGSARAQTRYQDGAFHNCALLNEFWLAVNMPCKKPSAAAANYVR